MDLYMARIILVNYMAQLGLQRNSIIWVELVFIISTIITTTIPIIQMAIIEQFTKSAITNVIKNLTQNYYFAKHLGLVQKQFIKAKIIIILMYFIQISLNAQFKDQYLFKKFPEINCRTL